MIGLTVRDAVVRYGPVTAVDAVSFDLRQGEIVALLGGSGSGKSSLLRAVAGLEPLVSGTVSWDGTDLAGVPVHKRGFGLMFQDGQLFPHLDVAANVGYGLFRLSKAQRRGRVEELLRLVGLEGYGSRPITALSGGQAQRVALARSLAPEPRLLLLDEPLAALDRGLRERMVGVLGEILRATGTAALYVTHDQDEAFAIADRVALLGAGRLLQLSSPDELWRHPATREVAEFLGYGPILEPSTAVLLGWPDPATVAIGPVGLLPAESGVVVPITEQRYHRGFVEVTVTLPDGQSATVRTGEKLAADTVSVRLDQDGCAVLPAG